MEIGIMSWVNHKLQSFFICLLLVLVLEGPDGVKDLVGGLADGDWPHLPRVPVHVGGEGIDLAEGEPGEGGEHEVEQVLPDVDHDVLVLEDALFHDLTTKINPLILFYLRNVVFHENTLIYLKTELEADCNFQL